MTSRKDREGTHMELPLEVLEPLRDADENNWKVVTEALRIHLAVETDSLAALYRQVEELEQSIQEYDDEIRSLEETRDDLRDRRKRLKQKIQTKQEERREYDTVVNEIIDRLVSDGSLGIESQRSELQEAAEIQNNGVANTEAIEQVRSDVRARVAEREVEIEQWRLRPDVSAAKTEGEEATGPREFASLQEGDDGPD